MDPAGLARNGGVDEFEGGVEAGGEDVRTTEDTYEVKQALAGRGFTVTDAEVTMHPKNTVRVEGKDAQHVLRLKDALEDHDDVQAVHANFDIPDEVMQQVG